MEDIITPVGEKKSDAPIHGMPYEFQKEAPSSGGGNAFLVLGAVSMVVAIGVVIVMIMTNRSVAPTIPDSKLAILGEQKTATLTPQTAVPNANALNINRPAENINVKEPENINVPTTPPVAPPLFGSIIAKGRDTDKDMLSDVEEVLYRTLSNIPDSDGDGHTDGVELMNLYNPAGQAPADLATSGLVRVFDQVGYAYSFLYPIAWELEREEEKQIVRMVSLTGEFFQIAAYENPDNLPILEWYLKQSPGVKPEQVENVTTKNGYKGIRSIDGLTLFIVKPLKEEIAAPSEKRIIYAITYNPVAATSLEYSSTFQMFLNSFEIVE